MVALIPVRAGSKRVPGKNTRLLAGHPLIAYTIAAAQQSGIFAQVRVCTDDHGVWAMGGPGTSWYTMRRAAVPDDQPDIAWVREMLPRCHPRPDSFAILRPTSPFRTAATIRRAYQKFQAMGECGDSIRAVEPVKQTPWKMWTLEGPGHPIKPLLTGTNPEGVPWHSCPTQTCPQVFIQNSSLEMSWTSNVEVHGTIHGRKVGPFFTEGYEGFSIDTEEDWQEAERIARTHPEALPVI